MRNFIARFFNQKSQSTNIVNDNFTVRNNELHNINSIIIHKLKENKDTELFTLNGKINIGYVSDIYDGDTCKIVMMYGEHIHKWNCRVMGVDTPELRTKNLKEKECGYYVRDQLRKKILDEIVIVECLEFDKYGRLLVYIHPYNDNMKIDRKTSYNQWLIDNKYAVEYYGGTKYEQEWDINNIKKE